MLQSCSGQKKPRSDRVPPTRRALVTWSSIDLGLRKETIVTASRPQASWTQCIKNSESRQSFLKMAECFYHTQSPRWLELRVRTLGYCPCDARMQDDWA